MRRRIYLDHAATRFPKPEIVLQTMYEHAHSQEAAVGRGAYQASQQASQILDSLRREIRLWIDAATSDEISLQSGGTEAINVGLLGLLRPGDHVVTTAAEHNSVLRPLKHLVDQQVIRWTVVPVGGDAVVDPDAVLAATNETTRLIAIVHAVNVNGAVQPVKTIGQSLAQRYAEASKPILFCDAAQSFGHLPLSVRELGIDVLASPGHKGGQGPLGTGFLYLRQSLHDDIQPTRFGGTGGQSESLHPPNEYPAKLEPGNRNVPAAAGWLAGLQHAWQGQPSPQQAVEQHAAILGQLAQQLYARLSEQPNLRVIGRPATPLLPVASIAVDGLPAAEAAMILDGEFGIEVRSGLHCAALVHEAIGSPIDGTLRISCGEETSASDLDALLDALAELS